MKFAPPHISIVVLLLAFWPAFFGMGNVTCVPAEIQSGGDKIAIAKVRLSKWSIWNDWLKLQLAYYTIHFSYFPQHGGRKEWRRELCNHDLFWFQTDGLYVRIDYRVESGRKTTFHSKRKGYAPNLAQLNISKGRIFRIFCPAVEAQIFFAHNPR